MQRDEKEVSKKYFKIVKLVFAEFKKSTNWGENAGWDLTFEDGDFIYSHFQISPNVLWKQGKKVAYKEAKNFMTRIGDNDPRKKIGSWYKVRVVARNMEYNDREHIMYNVESIIRKVEDQNIQTITEKEIEEMAPERKESELPIRKVKAAPDSFNFNQKLGIFLQNFDDEDHA